MNLRTSLTYLALGIGLASSVASAACLGPTPSDDAAQTTQPICAKTAQSTGYVVYDAETGTEYEYVVETSAPTEQSGVGVTVANPSLASADAPFAGSLGTLADPDVCYTPKVGRGDSGRRVKVTIRVATIAEMKKLLEGAPNQKTYKRGDSKAAFFDEHPRGRCSRQSGVLVNPTGDKSDAVTSTTDEKGTSDPKDDITWYERITWEDANTVIVTVSENHPEKILVQNEGRPDSERVVTGKTPEGTPERRSFRCTGCHDKPGLQDSAFQKSLK